MIPKPWPDAVEPVDMGPIPINESNRDQAMRQVEMLRQNYNRLLAEVEANIATLVVVAANIATNASDISDLDTDKQDVLTHRYSITESSENVELTGDAETPGTWKVYGTNSSGNRGWYSSGSVMDGIGAANKFTGVNNANDDLEWKSLLGTADEIVVTHTAGAMTLSMAATYAGGSSIVTVGTVGTGKWEGDAVADGYIASAETWSAKQAALTFGIADGNAVDIDSGATIAADDYAKFTATGLVGQTYAQVKTDLSLNSVENTAISSWAGTESVTTLGTIGTGKWEGDVIDHERGGLEADVSAYNGVVAISGGSTSAITVGIADNNIVSIDHAAVADNDYAKFTASGLEGRSYAEVADDIGAVTWPSGTAYELFTWNVDADEALSRNLAGVNITVTNTAATCTISIPQSVATNASPTFAALTLGSSGIVMGYT